MSRKKLQQLFQAAQRRPAPEPPAAFADDVMRALRRETPAASPPPPSLFDELNALFPRLAVAAMLLLALGVATNLALGTSEFTDDGDGLAQFPTQWLLLPEGF